MCYVEEGYVRLSDADSLGLEQLKTIFYSLFAIGMMGFAIAIGEIAVKRLRSSRSSETLENPSPCLESRSSETLRNSLPSLEGKYPIFCQMCSSSNLCQRCSSNFMLLLSQMDPESVGILKLKMESGRILALKWELIFPENEDTEE